MEAQAILDRLDSLGVEVTISRDKLQLEPGSRVPGELVEELKVHKQDIILLEKGYHLRYPSEWATDEELDEIEASVYQDGYVLLWSNVLEDFIAFYKTEADRAKIPPGFVAYSDQELRDLFGESKATCSLRIIHEAKKEFGRLIIQHREEDMT